MLQRQRDYSLVLRRSFMMMSFAAAILLVSLHWQARSMRLTSAAIAAIAQPVALPTDRTAQAQRPRSAAAAQLKLKVDLSDRMLSFYRKGELVAEYPIAIGQEGWETPTGTFEVIEMYHDPEWQHPITGEIVPAGADNPLGTRWIGFWTDGVNQIGFHGTNEEESIGQAISHGCVRMLNADIEGLYDQVEMGTKVAVVP